MKKLGPYVIADILIRETEVFTIVEFVKDELWCAQQVWVN